MRNAFVSVVHADGSGYRAVTPAEHFVLAWDWHPATDRVVYVAHQLPGMFVVPGTGGVPTQIASALDDEVGAPRWSPDGSRIAFVRGGGALDPTEGVHVVNADGSGLRDLTSSIDGEGAPSWSPDGSRILFASGGAHVWTVRPDGTALTSSVALPTSAALPRWAPDGRRVVYTGGGSVWTLGGDLRSPRRVTPECLPDCPEYLDARWSPRGDRLLSHRATDTVAVVLDATNGAELVRIAHARGAGDMSADGMRIAFTRWYGPVSRGLLTVDMDGSDERVVWSPTSGFASDARWIP